MGFHMVSGTGRLIIDFNMVSMAAWIMDINVTFGSNTDHGHQQGWLTDISIDPGHQRGLQPQHRPQESFRKT